MAPDVRTHPPAPPGMFVGAAVAFVLCVGLAAYAGYTTFDYSRQMSAYDSAPACKSSADLSGCRFQGSAEIVSHQKDKNDRPALVLVFAQLGSKQYTAVLDKSYMSQWQAWKDGSTVSAELWKGSVITQVAGVKTWDNPDTLPNAGVLPPAVFGGAALACVVAFLWLLWLNRRARAK